MEIPETLRLKSAGFCNSSVGFLAFFLLALQTDYNDDNIGNNSNNTKNKVNNKNNYNICRVPYAKQRLLNTFNSVWYGMV